MREASDPSTRRLPRDLKELQDRVNELTKHLSARSVPITALPETTVFCIHAACTHPHQARAQARSL